MDELVAVSDLDASARFSKRFEVLNGVLLVGIYYSLHVFT